VGGNGPEVRLDPSSEAIVYENPIFHSLFTAEELQKCYARLSECEYFQTA